MVACLLVYLFACLFLPLFDYSIVCLLVCLVFVITTNSCPPPDKHGSSQDPGRRGSIYRIGLLGASLKCKAKTNKVEQASFPPKKEATTTI